MSSADITISKGSYTVIIQDNNVVEGFTKKLVKINPPQPNTNQSTGSKDSIIVDLLMIDRVFSIKGNITSTDSLTAKQVKANLISIYEGADINGGNETLVYEGNSFVGFMEKLTIEEQPMDEPSDFESSPENYQEVIKYNVSFDFIEGVSR